MNKYDLLLETRLGFSQEASVPGLCCAASVPQHQVACGGSTEPEARGLHLGILVLVASLSD